MMESYRDIYNRFVKHYRNDNGGICLYPQFDNDLDLLLNWLDNDDALGDWAVDGTYVPNLEVDCSWRPPIGEDDQLMTTRKRLFYGLWMLILLIGIGLAFFVYNDMSSGEFYLCLIGLAIWTTLLSMFEDEDENDEE